MPINETMLEKIKSLPPFPETILEVQQLGVDAAVADLAKIVEGDAMVVADLLKAANSPMYSFKKEITNVSQVLALFGLNMSKSIIMGQSINKMLVMDFETYNLSEKQFSLITQMQAKLAYAIAKISIPATAEKIFLAALLQESGKILLAEE